MTKRERKTRRRRVRRGKPSSKNGRYRVGYSARDGERGREGGRQVRCVEKGEQAREVDFLSLLSYICVL